MIKLAVPLFVRRNLIRFQSVVNRRIFSLAIENGSFELVELDRDTAQPFIVDFLYTGPDPSEVRRVILQEVCDVYR